MRGDRRSLGWDGKVKLRPWASPLFECRGPLSLACGLKADFASETEDSATSGGLRGELDGVEVIGGATKHFEADETRCSRGRTRRGPLLDGMPYG
jgi:hypothetical protein